LGQVWRTLCSGNISSPSGRLDNEFEHAREDPNFWANSTNCSTITVAGQRLISRRRLTAHAAGAQIYLKREDLLHTGAHKINNAVGQALVARRMGKRRVIAETGAGQHGVATATVCSLFGLRCVIYMGAKTCSDSTQRVPNAIAWRRSRDGECRHAHLKRCNQRGAARLGNERSRHIYLLGSALGPHPYPLMVREFQSVIGTKRANRFICGGQASARTGCLRRGGSNAIGLFHPFVADEEVRLSV